MQQSAEVRWFFPKILSQTELDWFKSDYQVKSDELSKDVSLNFEDSRDDFYLFFENCESVGVKLRGSAEENKTNFEIKALLSNPKLLDNGNGIIGQIDSWIKWSSNNQGLLDIIKKPQQTDDRWIRVNKARMIRKFSADLGFLEEIWTKSKTLPRTGCNVELTSIEIEGESRNWYSIGFEAFGIPSKMEEVLIETVNTFFNKVGHLPEEKLNTLNSFSYPGWLSNLFFKERS